MNQLKITPLTPTIGAEISGIDLTKPLDAETIENLHQAWAEHLVLFFRDQPFTTETLNAFGHQMGEPHIHPADPGLHGMPGLLRIHVDENSTTYSGAKWHSDVSCDNEPPLGSILHLHVVPPAGGDTLFANMYAVYDSLSEPIKQLLDPLTAHYGSRHNYQGYHELKKHNLRDDPFPESDHPIVRTHPVTGKKCIFVDETFTLRINGLAEDESDALLKMLYDRIKEPRFQSRFRWQKNSVAMWDNRCTQHFAMWDYYPHTRTGHRYTIAGDMPY